MKPLKTKAQIRAELEQQVEAFLEQGGTVRDVPNGISGHMTNQNPFGNMVRNEPPQPRTPLVEIVKQIDARKSGHKAPTLTKNVKRPKRKLITDDFGEPIRWVWEE